MDSYDEDADVLPDDFIDQPDSPAPIPLPLPQEIPPVASQLGLLKIEHPNSPIFRPGGLNLLEAMELDEHAEKRLTNPFYPFASKMDWEVARFIYDTSLTQQQIDKFLQLDYVSVMSLRHNILILIDISNCVGTCQPIIFSLSKRSSQLC